MHTFARKTRAPRQTEPTGSTSIQRQVLEEEEEEVLQGKLAAGEPPVQLQGEAVAETRNGIPGPLKAGLEALSGMDLWVCGAMKTQPNPPESMRRRIPRGRTSTWGRARRSISRTRVGTWCSKCRGV